MKKPVSQAAYGATVLRRGWIRGVLWTCLLLTAAAIFVFSAQDGSVSGRLSALFSDFVIRMVEDGGAQVVEPGVQSFVEKLVRKAAHVLEFSTLGFFLRLLAGAYGMRRPTRRCWLAGTVWAALDEVHQLFVPGRGGMWQDVLLDAGGVLAGIVLAYAVLVIIGRVLVRCGSADGEKT
ncbi:MAG: VanZ family protein [Clostridia bacterium]|nr:VanZ family protein [Clostridia bacterium]